MSISFNKSSIAQIICRNLNYSTHSYLVVKSSFFFPITFWTAIRRWEKAKLVTNFHRMVRSTVCYRLKRHIRRTFHSHYCHLEYLYNAQKYYIILYQFLLFFIRQLIASKFLKCITDCFADSVLCRNALSLYSGMVYSSTLFIYSNVLYLM